VSARYSILDCRSTKSTRYSILVPQTTTPYVQTREEESRRPIASVKAPLTMYR